MEAMTATDVRELTRRVQRLEDIEAVRRTWHDYMAFLDSRRWEELADVFTEDGAVEMIGLDASRPGGGTPGTIRDGIYRGRRSIIDDFYNVGARSGRPVIRRPASGHFGNNLRVDLDGDEATTSAYFWEIVPGGGENHTLLIGTYQHRMRREPDRWRIKYLRITITMVGHLPWAGEFGAHTIGEVLSMPLP